MAKAEQYMLMEYVGQKTNNGTFFPIKIKVGKQYGAKLEYALTVRF